jgi:uncharacterized coiled-coil protein SlyX
MNITEPIPNDVTLQQVAERAGCTVKTVRRAIQDGRLTRRYVMSPRGPQLVFTPAEVEQWITARSSRRRGKRRASPERAGASPAAWSRLDERIAQLQSVLAESRSTIMTLSAQLNDQNRAVSEARASIALLSDRLAAVEEHLPVTPHPPGAASGNGASEAPTGGRATARTQRAAKSRK